MTPEQILQIGREYSQLPKGIQLDLQDHANALMSFRPLVEGVRTPDEQVEFSRGRDFVRTYSSPDYTRDNPNVQRYIRRLNSLFEEANSMVADGKINVGRIREIQIDVDIMMYGGRKHE